MTTYEVINELCTRFNTTTEDLINELYKYNIVIDWMALVVWGACLFITIFLSIKFKSRWEDALDDCELFAFAIIIPIAIIVFAAIIVPAIVCNLVGWYVSPTASALMVILR